MLSKAGTELSDETWSCSRLTPGAQQDHVVGGDHDNAVRGHPNDWSTARSQHDVHFVAEPGVHDVDVTVRVGLRENHMHLIDLEDGMRPAGRPGGCFAGVVHLTLPGLRGKDDVAGAGRFP